MPRISNDSTRNFSAKGYILWTVLILLVGLAVGYDSSQGLPGFYGENGLPCHGSCKTCSDATSGDSCEGYMFMNEVTSLGQFGENGQFYISTLKEGNDGKDSCNNEGLHRDECLQCDPGLILNADTLEGVSEGSSQQILITSSQLQTGSIGKNLEIYVDPESTKSLEFGTLKYPYRSMKAVASEVLNHYSHSDANITIFTKNCYLQTDTFHVMNMTSLSIQNHPDYQIANKKATIVLSNMEQEGVLQKARVHLLKHTNTDPSEVISAGDYTETELFSLSRSKFGIFISRTNFEMKNMEIYGDNINNGIFPSYLQEKTLRLGKSFLPSQDKLVNTCFINGNTEACPD